MTVSPPSATRPAKTRPTAIVTQETVWDAQAGDREAFDLIFNAYQSPIFNFVYRMMGDPEDAAELTQDAFLKAYLSLTNPASKAHQDDELNVGSWLYRIATNVCVDELRHRNLVKWQPWEAFISVFHPSQVSKENPERDVLRLVESEEVARVLGLLPPRERAALLLREYHGLGYVELADALGTTRAGIKSLLLRARDRFFKLYPRELRPVHAQGLTLRTPAARHTRWVS